MKAVAASFVEIKCPQFNKRVQVDPYLEDALCSSCLLKQGPYFCRFVFSLFCCVLSFSHSLTFSISETWSASSITAVTAGRLSTVERAATTSP